MQQRHRHVEGKALDHFVVFYNFACNYFTELLICNLLFDSSHDLDVQLQLLLVNWVSVILQVCQCRDLYTWRFNFAVVYRTTSLAAICSIATVLAFVHLVLMSAIHLSAWWPTLLTRMPAILQILYQCHRWHRSGPALQCRLQWLILSQVSDAVMFVIVKVSQCADCR